MHDRWAYISDNTFKDREATDELIYSKHAIYYPEYSKIVAISYARLYQVEGKRKRDLQVISGINEAHVIDEFMRVMRSVSIKKDPKDQDIILCGHNINNFDIPLLVKRFLKHRNNYEDVGSKKLPLNIKSILSSKPWDTKTIDTVNVWKFNGMNYTPLLLIADYLGLARTVDLMPLDELSEYYWKNIEANEKDTLTFATDQSANQTNLVLKFLDSLRDL